MSINRSTGINRTLVSSTHIKKTEPEGPVDAMKEMDDRISGSSTKILQQATMGKVGSQQLEDKTVKKDQLQESVKETKTRERRLVFETLKKMNKKIFKMNKKIFKKILKQEINRSMRSHPEFYSFSEGKQSEQDERKLNKVIESLVPKNLMNVDKEELGKQLMMAGITTYSEIADRMCVVGELLKSDLNNIDTFKNKLYHTIMNQRAKDGYPINKEGAKALRTQIIELNIGSEPKNVSQKKLAELLYDNGITRKKPSGEIAKSVCKEYKSALKNSDRKINKLAGTAKKLNTLLGANPEDKDLQKVNLEVISLLRKAFNSKAYQALKECEDNPTIQYLHEINLAMYTKVNLLDAYVSPSKDKKYLGDKLVEDHEEKKLGDAIQQVRDDAIQKRGLFSSHNCIKYIIKHFRQFLGAFKSQKIGSVFGNYDPHGDLGNNAGALYEETLAVNGKTGKALDVRTPSPTVGRKVSPEFRAALQAIQNQRMAEYVEEEGYGRPNSWIFTNYQDMTNKMNGEYDRSKPIMQLNDEFPLVFIGLTLSKDSAYFMDGIGHGEGDSLWKDIPTEKTFDVNSIDDFVETMKNKLKNDAHFTLKNRSKNKGNKLYFPAKTLQEITEYKEELDKIADQTKKLLEEIVKQYVFDEDKKVWLIKAAAKEFAYVAIQRYFLAKELAKLEEQGLNLFVITTSACKEDIDRGFSDHVKRMYMLEVRAEDDTFLAKIVNLPALMARYRVILNDRIQPLIGVATYVKRETAKKHLNKLSEKLGVKTESAIPLIKVK